MSNGPAPVGDVQDSETHKSDRGQGALPRQSGDGIVNESAGPRGWIGSKQGWDRCAYRSPSGTGWAGLGWAVLAFSPFFLVSFEKEVPEIITQN